MKRLVVVKKNNDRTYFSTYLMADNTGLVVIASSNLVRCYCCGKWKSEIVFLCSLRTCQKVTELKHCPELVKKYRFPEYLVKLVKLKVVRRGIHIVTAGSSDNAKILYKKNYNFIIRVLINCIQFNFKSTLFDFY